jgi:hypothetical protein
MRSINLLAAFLLLVPATALCAKWEVPANVTVRAEGKHASYMESVDFSYLPTAPIAFAQLKMCIAESVNNNAVTLSDSAGSFVGPATGIYYQNGNSQTVQGGGIFKYIDDSTSALIASGTTDGGPAALGLTRDIVKFDLKAATSEAGVTLKFGNITRAQQSTGSVANNGFGPVGMWRGAGAQRIYASLETVAGKIKNCPQ